jgi:hypothetical protein
MMNLAAYEGWSSPALDSIERILSETLKVFPSLTGARIGVAGRSSEISCKITDLISKISDIQASWSATLLDAGALRRGVFLTSDPMAILKFHRNLRGVYLSGQNLSTEIIISNIYDIFSAFERLVGPGFGYVSSATNVVDAMNYALDLNLSNENPTKNLLNPARKSWSEMLCDNSFEIVRDIFEINYWPKRYVQMLERENAIIYLIESGVTFRELISGQLVLVPPEKLPSLRQYMARYIYEV